MEKTLEIKRKAQRFVQNGDLDRAIEEYQKLLAADDSDPYTHVTLGDLHYKKGVLDEAGRRYQEAAEAYRKAGLVKNAIAVCKKMLRLNLRSLDTLKALAELHAQDGLTLDSGQYWAQYADTLLRSDRRTDAAEALEQASKLLPDEPAHAERAGELWNLEGEKLKASRALVRAARAYDGRGLVDQAQACRDRAEDLYPGSDGAPGDDAGNAAASPAAGSAPEPGLRSVGDMATPMPSSPGANGNGAAASASTGEGMATHHRPFVPPSTVGPAGLESTRLGGASYSTPEPAYAQDAASVPSAEVAAIPSPGPPVATAAAEETAAVPMTPAHESHVPAEVATQLDEARAALAAGEREAASEALLRAAQAWEAHGGLEHAATIYHELARSPQAGERLYRLWLGNCERREQWHEAAAVCCELGDHALSAQEPAAAHEWFVQARAYDPGNEKAARRLERLADWGRRGETEDDPRQDRVTVSRRMPEDLDVDLQELVSAFQAGVREQVQADDAASHYDLGMTYRQMGLLDEAVAEFRLAARDPSFQVKCTDMLGRSLLERGDFGAAIAELERGLSLPGLPSETALAFRYSLGLVLEASGRMVEALEQFEVVFATQPNYPDVAAKIRELRR